MASTMWHVNSCKGVCFYCFQTHHDMSDEKEKQNNKNMLSCICMSFFSLLQYRLEGQMSDMT